VHHVAMPPANIISARLDSVTLPPLVRPPVGPNEEPTLELVTWAGRYYAYSSIAHVRNILRGLLVLATSGNVETMFLVERHLYEWTMHAVFIQQNFKRHLVALNLQAIWEMFEEADTANGWIRRHGAKYVSEIPTDEFPDTLRVKRLVAAYEKCQADRGEIPSVQDDYGYLSEHSHANAACFLPYRVFKGRQVSFSAAPLRYELAGIAHAATLEWLVAIRNILGTSKEDAVRQQFSEILNTIAKELK